MNKYKTFEELKEEPVGYKFDTSINKPVLMKRCDNYYYAYPTINGWIYYRSRYLGERDKEIIDIDFCEWSNQILNVVINETNALKEKNKHLQSKLDKINELCENNSQVFVGSIKNWLGKTEVDKTEPFVYVSDIQKVIKENK